MCILRWTRSHHQDYFLWHKKAPWETKKTFLAHRMSFVARQYSCTASYVPVRRHIYTFDTFTRTVVRLNLLTTVAVFLTFSASDVGFELFVSSQPVAPSGKTWRSCSQSSWVWGNSGGFVSAPQCRCSLSTDAAAAEDDRCSSLRSPHDSSICCMHSDRLPLIHLKNFVVLYVYTVYQVNFGNLWCLTLYRTRISACTAAHSKMFFI